ncbi:MAG: VOC family protein [Candidatus Kapaibacterium sp.]
MAKINTYLNFPRNTEEAFNFYKSVFGGDFLEGKIMRFGEVPPIEGRPPLPEEDKNLVMHVALPILGGHLLMGSDAPESMGFTVNKGNNVYISIHTDSRAQADDLFAKLTEGGVVEMPMADMFWGDYFGSFTDKFGIKWMINYSNRV